MSSVTRAPGASTNKGRRQEPFSRVAPLLRAALLLGSGGGFLLASVLTLTQALRVVSGPWWTALAQAHGHVQVYGWAALFVVGVALHFLPRLRGAPLAAPRLVPWLLSAQIASLLLRICSQPLLVAQAPGRPLWRLLLMASGPLECIALLGLPLLLFLTSRRGPALAARKAFAGVLPFIACAFGSLAIASCVNLLNVLAAAAGGGLVPAAGDDLNVTLGLLGFLVPMALAMSAQSLPMYAGLEAFPRQILWPLAGVYLTGLVLTCVGTDSDLSWASVPRGIGLSLLGLVIIIFVVVFMRMMRTRGRLPKRVSDLAPSPMVAAQTYQKQITREKSAYGPFVALVASAYLWAMLGGLLLLVDGGFIVSGAEPLFSLDAMRHSLAVGFITLLICGIAPRMLPGFSGGKIASARLVSATLWLGNSAALLRVGSLLVAPAASMLMVGGYSLTSLLFGLSGPLGLALVLCLTINLWPALRSSPSKEL